jgi:hypothetical protein
MSDLQQQKQQQRARRGCLFYGCIVGVVCMLMLLAGFLYVAHQVKKMVNEFTDSKPMAMPTVTLSASQMNELRQRLNTFSNAVAVGKPDGPLTLNSDEINALIQDNQDTKGFKGKVYVTLQDDKVKAEVSLPWQRRYLNGDARLSVSLRNGMLGAYIEEINIKGKPLPGPFMQKLRVINWAEGANTNSNSSATLNKLQGIEVKDGRLIITPLEPARQPQ